ncbi:Uncharacterized protein GBIM_06279 [Gryllus bimaculatus]|nr:Uncharacterized protein GBIM_06279 [Gryllus bimaculatus]
MEADRRAGRPNPSDEAGALSTLFFWWTVPLFRDGYSHDLAPEDLCDARRMDRSALLGNALEQHWLRQEAAAKRRKGRPNLRTAILKTFGAEYVKLGILVFITDIVLRLAQPLLLGGLLSYFELDSAVPRRDAYLYAGGIVLSAVLNALCSNHYLMRAALTGMRVRVACCALIYRKALRLSQGALGRTAVGQMVNLLSNDVSRFDLVCMLLHYMWAAPLAGAICAYFMYREVGWPAFTGIAAVFVVVPLQAYMGHLSAKFRHKMAVKTDKRVRLMDEIISGIQVIKMYAWEKPFAKLVANARRQEIRVVTKTSFIRGLFMTFGLCTTRIALACTLATMAFAEMPLRASQVFVVLSYFNILSQTMSMDFMCHEELQVPQLMEPPSLNGQAGKEGKGSAEQSKGEGEDDDVMVAVKGVTARWEPTQPEPTLANVDLAAHRGQLIAVIGHVGAGKDTDFEVAYVINHMRYVVHASKLNFINCTTTKIKNLKLSAPKTACLLQSKTTQEEIREFWRGGAQQNAERHVAGLEAAGGADGGRNARAGVRRPRRSEGGRGRGPLQIYGYTVPCANSILRMLCAEVAGECGECDACGGGRALDPGPRRPRSRPGVRVRLPGVGAQLFLLAAASSAPWASTVWAMRCSSARLHAAHCSVPSLAWPCASSTPTPPKCYFCIV